MKKLNSDRGVTLIALAVTVAVLLILVSVTTYSGLDTLKSAKLTVFTTELKIIQNKVNELYDDYKDKTIDEIEKAGIGKNKNVLAPNIKTAAFNGAKIIENNDFVYWNREIINKLGIENVKGEFLVNFKTRQVISIKGYKYKDITYYTLEQSTNGLYNVEYVQNLSLDFEYKIQNMENNKYKIIIEPHYTGNINKCQVHYVTPSNKTKISEELEFIVSEVGAYKIQLVNGDIKSNEKQINIGIKAKKE